MFALPDRAAQAHLLDAGTVRFVTGVHAHGNGWHCWLSPRCLMDCDCPPSQGIDARHLSQPRTR